MAYGKQGFWGRPGTILGIVFGIFFLVGSVFLVVGWFSFRSAQEFAAHGVDVTGRIEKKWESTRECKDSNSDVTRTCTDFNLGYSFEVGGQTYHASGTTGYDDWAAMEEGALILVRVLPDAPETVATSFRRDSVDASGGMGVLAWVFGGLGAVFALIGGGGLAVLALRARGAAWLRQNGVKRGAVVLALEETAVTVNDRRLWRITWKDDTGATGRSRGRARGAMPAVGTRITVFADPAGKREPVWEDDA